MRGRQTARQPSTHTSSPPRSRHGEGEVTNGCAKTALCTSATPATSAITATPSLTDPRCTVPQPHPDPGHSTRRGNGDTTADGADGGARDGGGRPRAGRVFGRAATDGVGDPSGGHEPRRTP